MTFSIIVAADRNNGIGKDGRLPWPRLRADLEHFKSLTMGGAVIMGRRTWDSLPASVRPLPGRANIVVTRNGMKLSRSGPPGPCYAQSFDQALGFADGSSRMAECLDPAWDVQTFVIGGGEIYKLALAHPDCSTVYLTRVCAEYPADTWLPPLVGWERAEVISEHIEPVPYRIERWVRS